MTPGSDVKWIVSFYFFTPEEYVTNMLLARSLIKSNDEVSPFEWVSDGLLTYDSEEEARSVANMAGAKHVHRVTREMVEEIDRKHLGELLHATRKNPVPAHA